MRTLAAAAWLAIWLFSAAALAQEDDEDNPFRPGLVANYLQAGRTVTRIEASPALAWEEVPPDIRFLPGEVEVVWRGRLLTQGADTYQLHFYAVGDVEIMLGERVVIEGKSAQRQWFSSAPLKLPHDYHPLTVRYVGRGAAKQLRMFWSSTNFSIEPIPAKQLHHEPMVEADVGQAFERGQQVARSLCCAACHDLPGEDAPLASPALDRLAGNMRRDWLVPWLDTRHHRAERLSTAEARDIAAFLLDGAPQEKSVVQSGDVQRGKRVFETIGCLACHQVNGQGTAGELSGGDLTQIAEKRPAEFFTRWLANPADINRDYRMPTFDLLPKQRDDLAAYLGSLKREAAASAKSALEGDVARGKELVVTHGCASCHRLPALPLSDRRKRLKTPATAECKQYDVSKHVAEDDLLALQAFLKTASELKEQVDRPLAGARILREKNCLNCHAREGAEGLAPKLVALAKADAELAPLVPALTPPSLLAVGDKLHDTVLLAMIKRMEQPHRDYLQVRMPHYHFTQEELEALLAYFVHYDRISPQPPDERAHKPQGLPPQKELIEAGQKLVIANSGFGCTSCHAIGKYLPSKAPINARGPNLSNVGFRIREPYFYRWCQNPARIVPGQEMPSVSVPAKGILKENLQHQLAAVWNILNTPGFEPKDAGPLRIVRRSGDLNIQERGVVGTDVIKIDGKTYIAPLVIGLPNRHNLLFDLETGHLASWWLGDTMEQRTQGKNWYWQSDAPSLLPTMKDEHDIVLTRNKQHWIPHKQGQTNHQLTDWAQPEGGPNPSVFLGSIAKLSVDPTKQSLLLSVSQRFTAQERNAFQREVVFRGTELGDSLALRVLSSEAAARESLSDDRREFRLKNGTKIRLLTRGLVFQADGLVVIRSAGKTANIDLEYDAGQDSDISALPSGDEAANHTQEILAIPGLTALRLPLPQRMMPTGFSWLDDRLYVSSLEGRVWMARDTDGDQAEDVAVPVSDELAAPYGLHATRKTKAIEVDVINKFGLLRLADLNDDGYFEFAQALTTDWGHTDDYHDWAVGLIPNGKDGYFAALPCQQDARSVEAAHRRGQAIEIDLAPRSGMEQDTKCVVDAISTGHRFPMGIARNRVGDIFVTDNQGNYNPFNELNHVVKGKDFGFVNSLDKGKPKPPLTSPAINIPHPWTRSVNGICFLETPEPLLKEKKELWGAFEGHLIGCEYDTRRLIRMSLQQVGDTYQGACYPFSLEKPQGENFLGPISCAISPRGELYVGSIRDSGWGGGANVGEIVRISPPTDQQLPPGIAEVRAQATGFEVRFTQPVDAMLAGDAKNYAIESFTRESTPAYGGPDKNRRVEKIEAVSVAEDRRSVSLELAELRPGYVYEFHLRPLSAGEFFPAEAYYTLNVVPK